MLEEQIKDIVAFCVLMQNGGGILEKSPIYIEEKYKQCLGGARPMDSINMRIYSDYIAKWMKGKSNDN